MLLEKAESSDSCGCCEALFERDDEIFAAYGQLFCSRKCAIQALVDDASEIIMAREVIDFDKVVQKEEEED